MIEFVFFVVLFVAISFALPLLVETTMRGSDPSSHVNWPFRFKWQETSALSPVTLRAVRGATRVADIVTVKMRALVGTRQGYIRTEFATWPQHAVAAGYSIGAPISYERGTIYLCHTPSGEQFACISHETGPEIVLDKHQLISDKHFGAMIAQLASRFISTYAAGGRDRDFEVIVRLEDRGTTIGSAATLSHPKDFDLALRIALGGLKLFLRELPFELRSLLKIDSRLSTLAIISAACLAFVLAMPSVPRIFHLGSIYGVWSGNLDMSSFLSAVAVSSNGKFVAGANDHRVGIWSGPRWGPNPGGGGGAVGDNDLIAVSGDGRYLACSWLNTVSLWDTSSFAELWALASRRQEDASSEGRIRALAFSPDNRRLAVSESDNSVRVYSTEGREIGSLRLPVGSAVESLLYSKDGRRVAILRRDGSVLVGGIDGEIRQIRPGTSLDLARIDRTLTFPLAGPLVATITTRNSEEVELWHESGSETLHAPAKLAQVAISWDGRFIAAVSVDRRIFVWSTSGAMRDPEAEFSEVEPQTPLARLVFLNYGPDDTGVIYSPKVYFWKVH